MKFINAVLVLSAAALGAAQSIADLPACAQDCASEGFINTGCGFDVECVCKNDSFIDSIRGCIANTCNEADKEKTINFAVRICNSVKVTIDTSLPGTQSPTATKDALVSTETGADSTPTTAEESTPAQTTPAVTTEADSSGNRLDLKGLSVAAVAAAAVYIAI